MNVESLKECRYPVEPWQINEVVGGEETSRWKFSNPRLWFISFNDVTLEIQFETVSLIHRETERRPQHITLIGTVSHLKRTGSISGETMPQR